MSGIELTQREQWAETEAAFCDLMVKTCLENAKGWHDKGVSLYGEDNAKMAMACQIHANCWNQMAANLRMPHRSRLEMERGQ